MAKDKAPAIVNEYDSHEALQSRMKATKQNEIVIQDPVNLVIDNDEPLEKKEEKIIFAAKAKKFSEFFLMRMIGMIYTEGQWFTKWITVNGKRESVPGDYTDEVQYMNHLCEITGFSKRYTQSLVQMYRIYVKHEKYLNSIHYETVGHIGKLFYIDKAMELVDTGAMTKNELTKLVTTKSEGDLAEALEQKSYPAEDAYQFDPASRVTVKKDTIFVNDEPVFQIINNESKAMRNDLVTFIAAEQKKTSLGEEFKDAADLYQKRLMEYIAEEKIPVIIPVDSDISDIKAFQRAAEKAMAIFYKDWKINH